MRAVLQQALDALNEWSSLIQHSYTGTSKGMSDLQYADNNGHLAITAIKQALAEPDTCAWTPMGDDMPDSYDTACGQAWGFNDGGPVENNCTFCHGCGKPLEVKE